MITEYVSRFPTPCPTASGVARQGPANANGGRPPTSVPAPHPAERGGRHRAAPFPEARPRERDPCHPVVPGIVPGSWPDRTPIESGTFRCGESPTHVQEFAGALPIRLAHNRRHGLRPDGWQRRGVSKRTAPFLNPEQPSHLLRCREVRRNFRLAILQDQLVHATFSKPGMKLAQYPVTPGTYLYAASESCRRTGYGHGSFGGIGRHRRGSG